MSLAISLAEQRIGLTGENPSVGCVLVKNNQIIKEWTGFNEFAIHVQLVR